MGSDRDRTDTSKGGEGEVHYVPSSPLHWATHKLRNTHVHLQNPNKQRNTETAQTQKLHKHRICQRAEMYGACYLGHPYFLKWHRNIQTQTKCKMEEGGKSRGYFTVLTKALLLCSEAWSDAGVCFNLYH